MNIQAIAERYQSAEHQPNHPSYQVFARETLAQYRALVNVGLKVDFVPGTLTGYSSSMIFNLDYLYRITIAVDGAPLLPGHPLAEYLPEFGVTLNALFRTVHDVNGHFATRSPFETFTGELIAYQHHARMYSDEAQLALYSETIGQLCVYYHTGDFVTSQKCAILPIEL